ncbi:MAG: nucleoside-diphosphate sugar epimerase/dehydratase, partial [Bacteroidota bacterium]
MRRVFRRITLALLATASLSFPACELINPDEEVPSFLFIDSFSFTTVYATQGLASFDLPDAHVYVDNRFIGIYELPATVPIMASGKVKVSILPGTRENLQSIAVGNDSNLILALIFLPFCWLGFYAFTGYYKDIYRRSRFREFWQTLYTGTLGVLVLFFVFILDDSVSDYRDYYRSFLVLWSLHVGLTFTGRMLIAGASIRKVQRRKIGFPTLLIGSGPSALRIFEELEAAPRSEGFKFIGYIDSGAGSSLLERRLPCLGSLDKLQAVIHEHGIEEVLIAVEEHEHARVPELVNQLQNEFVRLKILPDAFSMVVGLVKMNNILGAILLEVDFEVMPEWQKSAKRLFDILFS